MIQTGRLEAGDFRKPLLFQLSCGAQLSCVLGLNRIHSLQFADQDAKAVRDFLLDPNGGGVPPENLLYLENQDASDARIRGARFDFLIKPGPDDLAIIYFSGHGTNDRKRPDNYYLLGYDTDYENLASTGVPMWDLQEVFERTLRANVVTLADACHSAAIGQTSPNLVNQRWTTASHGSPRRAITTASNIAEYSREDLRWGGGHGVFTWFLLQGLKGEADANHDRQVSVGELFDFVHSHVVAETGGSQTPTALAGLSRALVLTPHVSKAASAKLPLFQSASAGAAQ